VTLIFPKISFLNFRDEFKAVFGMIPPPGQILDEKWESSKFKKSVQLQIDCIS